MWGGGWCGVVVGVGWWLVWGGGWCRMVVCGRGVRWWLVWGGGSLVSIGR